MSQISKAQLKNEFQNIKRELRTEYHAFKVPQQIYEDFVAEFDDIKKSRNLVRGIHYSGRIPACL